MTFGMYSIYDAKARVFTEPFCSQNDATAMRVFSNQVIHNDLIKDNRIDFELYKCGNFDNANCEVSFDRLLLMSGKDVMVDE